MSLTAEQVLQMAPDPASAAAGKKLAATRHWVDLGRTAAAMWGKCQGSAVYQVKIDLANLGYHCSCPSRKFPCKHVLGLLLLSVESPQSVPEAAQSHDWVNEWLSKRQARTEKAEAKAGAEARPVDEKAQAKRAEQRHSRVQQGLERLDLWLNDLVRSGIAGLERKPHDFWEEQAKRLVDAQASGLASRIRRLADIPNSSQDWPERMLCELGRVKTLMFAYHRLDQLDEPLRHDLRQLIGWTVAQEELDRDGEKVVDTWAAVGQWIDDDDRVRSQRTWLVGRGSGHVALILNFSVGTQPFADGLLPGTELNAELAFYPGSSPQRAKITQRDDSLGGISDRVPGCDSIEEFFDQVSTQLSRQPWLNSFGVVLRDVTVAIREGAWYVRDGQGEALPLSSRTPWKMISVTGGKSFDLAGEWDGQSLRPLGMILPGGFQLP